MWETSLCSHSSSSIHLSEPEFLPQHLRNPLAQQLLLPALRHSGLQTPYTQLCHSCIPSVHRWLSSVRADNEEGLSILRAVLWKYQVQNNARTEKFVPVIWTWEPRQWKAFTLIFVFQLPSILWNKVILCHSFHNEESKYLQIAWII